uniref:Calsyntenin-1 n=1 Tax=Dicentrarchus labrax TaxID=13489 RepID=A0A8P4GDK4_DICLA
MRFRGNTQFASAVGLVLGLLCAVEAAKANKHKPWIETTYHGIVTENDDKVLLDPPLIALDKDAPLRYAGEICGFRIHGQNVPFEAVVLDKSTGEGVIRAKDKLDCELQKEHTFTIQAYDCGEGPDGANMKKSHKATVHIQVNDINEYSPVFKEKSYKATVIEGKKYDSILKVEAVDADCSFQFSQICNYEIVTPDVPFTVDKDGFIKNTEKLSYGKERMYKLTVTAYDCGKNRASEDVLVKISVKPTCKPSWQGFSKRIEYEPGTGSLALFPSMHLETCDEPITSIRASVELETNHIGKGCDRDTYSEKSLHKLCGASSGTVELLPAPSSSANWTVGLPTDNGHDSDQVFEFNGTQAIKVPDGMVSTSLKEPFTISVWMRHGPGAHEKETILCNSDKTEMNRHHYSLYVHNCRLILLLRQDPSEAENYKPAEFHWKLDQVCDKEWHHYVLNVEFPTVSLFVDGTTFEPFLVTEDYPLHASKIETQLTIGACWQGGNARMAQFFRGNLAGLMIRSGKLENKKVIDCLYTCKEGLDVQLPEEVASAVKVEFNPNQSSLTVEGDDIDAFDKVMQHISYLNSRQFPTPGIRHLRISTTVKCFNEESCVTVPDAEGYVMVLQPEEPKISLSGIDHFARSAAEFESQEGVTLFPELRIVSTITQHLLNTHTHALPKSTVVSEEIMHNLDTCEVTVVGDELDGEHEGLEVDMSQLQQHGLEMSSSNLGLVITGVNTMANYEQVLHLIRYKNCSNRIFMCERTHVQIRHSLHLTFHFVFVCLCVFFHAVVPSAATIVIVVCVSFLVFMIILGVFRIRAAHQSTMRDQENGKENEMDWDDSALTITVNPMEVKTNICREAKLELFSGD